MISQGFPLWAVEPDGTAHAVVGWRESEEISYPVLVPLEPAHVRGAVAEDSDGAVYRYTTTDPRPECPDPIAEASEAEIRNMLVRISSRMHALGATGPAWQIMKVLES